MPEFNDYPRVLISGGGTFLGDQIALALLSAGIEVSLLVRPDKEDLSPELANRVNWVAADLWNPASLRGRARGHTVMIHTVGSIQADNSKGLSLNHLNVMTARNAANLAVNGGIQRFINLSTVWGIGLNRSYIKSKREAEGYIIRSGLNTLTLRLPLIYVRGQERPFIFRMESFLADTPPFSWFLFRKSGPLPIDTLARAITWLVLNPQMKNAILYAPDLRKYSRLLDLSVMADNQDDDDDTKPRRPQKMNNEDVPFGWTP
ncbi:NAD(P)H-binding protein [Anaerolineales bacterium]